jgi:hypothetical protein
VGFYNRRGIAEQNIKEGKASIKWTRLSCRTFTANAARLQLHALAYNLGNFVRTLATPEAIKDWTLTSLREKLIKIGAKVVSHGRYVAFQMAEVAAPGSHADMRHASVIVAMPDDGRYRDDCQAVAKTASNGRLLLRTPYTSTRSFLMTAASATIFGLPAAVSRSYKALRAGLYCDAEMAGKYSILRRLELPVLERCVRPRMVPD